MSARPQKVWFIRVGGTAMGSVAAALAQSPDHVVRGSETDLYEPMASYLVASGVDVQREFNPDAMRAWGPDVVVVGNAVSRGNEELEAALDHGLTLVSLPQAVAQWLIGEAASYVVSGTHGKTTTTCMLTHILQEAGREPGFMIGGIPGNFEVSCRPAAGENPIFVSEGDEYDSAYFDKRSKFIHYRPQVAIVNNIEFDHSDIFRDLEDVKRTFRHFVRLVPRGGQIIAAAGDANVDDVLRTDAYAPVVRFGIEEGDWQARRLTAVGDHTTFDVWEGEHEWGTIDLPVSGDYNVRNWLAATVAARAAGVDFATVQRAARSFKLPRRRLEEVGTWHGATVVEDFAHHPTAIALALRALRQKYPGRRLVACFEPRSNTTTRNLFQRELAEAFAEADVVLIGALDRPHRYTDAERLDTGALVRQWQAAGKQAWVLPLEMQGQPDWGGEVEQVLREWVQPGDVVAVLTNGDFGGLRRRIHAGCIVAKANV